MQREKIKSVIERYRKLVSDWFQRLSKREKMFVIAPLPVIAFVILYGLLYRPVADAFDLQRIRLSDAQSQILSVAASLEKYNLLRSKKLALENRYREVEIKEGGLTLLEGLIRSKIDPPPGSFTIKEGGAPSNEFGGNYEQQTFVVDFTTGDLAKLMAFLQEVVHGPKPLILKRLDIRKQGERLHVVLDVCSIRRIKTV